MPLPQFLAKPVFHVVYLINRRMEGATVPPIHPVDEKQRAVFDRLPDSAQQSGPNTPLAHIKVKPEDFPYLHQVELG